MTTRSILSVYTVLLIALVYLPVLLIPVFSVNDSQFVSLPLQGFTWKWYGELLSNRAMLDALRNSVILGLATAFVSTAIGMLTAYSLIDARPKARKIILACATLPIVMPGIIIGISLLILLVRVLGLNLSLWTVGLGHLVLCCPFSVVIIMSRVDGFDRHLIEAARDLGEPEFGIFLRVVLPLCWPALLASFLLCFTLSFDEFVVSYFLSGIDVTLPVYIYSQLRFPNAFPMVLAAGTLILLTSGILVTVAEILRRRNAKP